MSDNNPLRKLILADQEANEIIAREESYRTRRLQEAENAAKEVYESRKAEEETKFQNEVKTTEGEGDAMTRALDQQAREEKSKQEASYNASKDAVVDLLLHHVTTCNVSLSESEVQAFLAIARKKTAVTNPDE